MKPLVVVFATLSLSVSHFIGFGIDSLKSASAQVFRCDDTSLGEDEREEIREENSRRESRVAIGSNCRDANYYEYLNQRNQREAELEQQRMQDWQDRSERTACEFYGIDSPNCTHEGLRRQAREEEARAKEEEGREHARQIEAAQIQQEAQRESNLRQSVAAARDEVRKIQEDIAFWSRHPEMQQQHKEQLPLAEADLQRAEQELQNYLNQRAKR